MNAFSPELADREVSTLREEMLGLGEVSARHNNLPGEILSRPSGISPVEPPFNKTQQG